MKECKTGVYDNVTTMQREYWLNGVCMETISACIINKVSKKPFGTFPDARETAKRTKPEKCR